MKKYYLIIVIQLICSFVLSQTKEITLEDIWKKGTFRQKGIGEIVHLKDGEHYTMLDSLKSIVEYAYSKGEETKTICNIEDLKANGLDNYDYYSFSMDENKILFATETESIYRNSSKSINYIWDIKSKKLTTLSNGGKQQLAAFSHDGNIIAFVRENNLFVKDLTSDKETQITKDGLKNKIINGAPDWVYEEEFNLNSAFDWSPDGKKIAFMKFDESKVKEYQLLFYGDLYPEEYKYKYPKAGEDNSVISVWIYDLESGKTNRVDVGGNPDQYIPRIKWTNSPELLSIVRLKRLQNQLDVLVYDANKNITQQIVSETNKYYIEEIYDLEFLKDNSFIRKSDMDGFMHFYHYDIKGKLINQLTKGRYEVKDIKAVDETNKIIYYTSNEQSVLQTHLYSIKFDGTDKKQITFKDGTNRIDMSEAGKYFINYYSDANTPLHISLNSTQSGEVKVLQDNKKLKTTAEEYSFVKKEFFKFITSQGYELNGYMMKPAEIQEGKKYPVLIDVYGGPGSQTVIDAWSGSNFVWYQMLCQKGYIIVGVDGRSTGGRGEEFQKINYLKLGTVEVEDQIEAAKYLSTLDFVDKDRIGIWGWSYGGSMTAMCMMLGADYFKMGIAVAPVTDWRYYDNIYMERYMRTPKENEEGYRNGSALTYADKLKGKFLLIHGAADDNVHTQNSMDLITALVEANKQFEFMLYPNKNHSILGANTRLHLYTKMTEFILNNL